MLRSLKANRHLLVFLFLLVAFVAACAASSPPDIRITEPWARSSPMAAGNGAVYMVIANEGGTADALVGVASDVSEAVEIHETVMENQVMRMRPVEGQRVEIPARGRVELKPGGLHIMLIGLQQPLEVGSRIQLTLQFEKSGPMTVEAEVRPMEGMGQ
ncbi:MAG: copper chaperone PCu(A)C [Caldilineae bacterium]|nr:MAG: copper chaperone PCu(A)C [Caldilineae bacterium]